MDMALGGLRQLVMNKEVWCAVVHGVTKSWTRLSDGNELSEYAEKLQLLNRSHALDSDTGVQLLSHHILAGK